MTAKPEYNYFDDEHPDHVLLDLKQWVLSRIERKNCAFFYVGQTCNPTARLWRHQKDMQDGKVARWDAMHVIYGNHSLGFVTRVENELIKLVKEHPKYVKQGLNSAGGRYEDNPTFKLYVLLDDQATQTAATEAKSGGKRVDDGRPLASIEADLIAKFERAIVGKSGRTPVWAFYIGMAADVDRRLKQHQEDAKVYYRGDHWDEMRVLFETTDLNRILNMESRLIKYARDKYGAGKCMNGIGGRKLDADGRLPYTYVYFLEEMNNGNYDL